jgi:diadenosine tetraphosphate (Ap4A) HIT family hydrolase
VLPTLLSSLRFEHEPEFFNLPDYVLADIMHLAKQIANAQQVIYQPIKVGMLVAGFDIPHAHLHLIPMHDYHDITSKQILEGSVNRVSYEALYQVRLNTYTSVLIGQRSEVRGQKVKIEIMPTVFV